MRRLRVVGIGAGVGAVLALIAGGGSAAAAGIMDWTINGVPLPAGKKAPVTLQSTGPVVLSFEQVTGTGASVTCSSFVAKGSLIGGEEGTGKLKPKFTGCSGSGGVTASVKGVIIEVSFDGEFLHPSTWTSKYKFEIITSYAKQKLMGSGIADSEGPFGEMITFPETPLPASTLEIGGRPASLQMVDVFTLKKGGTLGVGEL